MGNQPSQQEGARPLANSINQNIRNLLRPPGTLGLNKTELDKRCQPSGLYPTCKWEDKAIRRLIADGKLASRLRGKELRTSPADTECPICFLHYGEVNVTKCCQASLCTECYLQVRPQRVQAPCPFCNASKLYIAVAKTMDPKAIQKRAEEEQLVIEATIRARAEVKQDKAYEDFAVDDDEGDDENERRGGDIVPQVDGKELSSPSRGEFGSYLAQDKRLASIRARSESFASAESSSQNTSSEHLVSDITALAMTPEERALLEQEVRVQHSHPLAQRMEQEQMERRLQNERDYYRTQAGRLRELRARRELMGRTLGMVPPDAVRSGSARDWSLRGSPEWNRMISAHDNPSGRGQHLDDLVVLEAAILLSMEEEARRLQSSNASDLDGSETGSGRDTNGLLRRLGEISNLPSSSNGTAELAAHLSNVMRSLQSSRQEQELVRSAGASSDAPENESSLDIGSILLRGITEEEQIAMAIAASLTESGGTTPVESNSSTALDTSQMDSSVIDPIINGANSGSYLRPPSFREYSDDDHDEEICRSTPATHIPDGVKEELCVPDTDDSSSGNNVDRDGLPDGNKEASSGADDLCAGGHAVDRGASTA
ncbi:hypothetical protein MPSEU_000594800 [Mayamaea pseudoterrestris]|nr:hypothetical protein MPSEU_000594800 [Mayamaea pseudoterrestris]